jgi:rhamnogalacturonyl hydrolase YesR
MISKVTESLKKVENWVEQRDYKAYEPFDGLSSWLRPFTFKSLFLERILQQVVRQSAINLRPLFGVKPQESTKGRGYMAWGYLEMYKLTGDEEYKTKALENLDWLDKNKAPGYETHSWGNHFDFSSRGGRLPKLEPIIVWTSIIGQVYLDAWEMFGIERHLEVARSICDWILALPREKTNRGSCLSYVTYTLRSIHNSNMLGAAMLGRSSKIFGDSEMKDVARDAMLYSCSRQLEDGSWWYGEAEKFHWIDNFHTGYNLDSLKTYIEATGDTEFEPQMRKGFDFFKASFFGKDGCPAYYHDRVFPIDSQCASQAIETLANFCEYDEDSLELAQLVANWTIDNMQNKKGYFYYRKYPLGITAKTPMLHWAQATTYRGLALLLNKLSIKDKKGTAKKKESVGSGK